MHHPEDTERRLLDAAKALWREGGFSAITTRAVAHRAGVNEVTLFRHFGSKDGLIQAMVDHFIEDIDTRSLVRLESHASLEEDLFGWARAYLTHALPVADVLLLSLFTAMREPETRPWHAAFAVRVREALTRHLETLAAEGKIPPGAFTEVAHHFYASLFAHVLTAHVRPSESVDDTARSLAAMFARTLSGAGTETIPPGDSVH
jgi:AcrR family transcriptional regulator